MALYKAQQEQAQRDADAMETEDEGEDDDGLAIPMEQLLDDFEEMTMKE
jgi:nonsense-mediated mRNA decay protein 3